MAAQQPKTLAEEIELDIDHHRKWEATDLNLAQIFIGIGILSSIASAVVATNKFNVDEFYGVILAAIPGAVLVVDRTFKFSGRAAWHALYKASLKSLFRRLRDENADVKLISSERSKLEMQMEKMFPPLDSGPQTDKNS